MGPIVLLAIAALIGAAPVAQSAAPTEEERYLAALRERRLYRLAESYCQEQLARDDLAARRRATLAVELSQTFAAHALTATPDSSDDLWRQAAGVVDEFVARQANTPFAILAEIQSAQVRLAHGEALAEQFAATGGDEQARQAALGELRQAIERFVRVQTHLAELERVRRPTGGAADKSDLSSAELRALDKHVRFMQARGLVLQAGVYGRNTPDWTNSLAQAAELLAPLAQMATTEPLGWRSRLAQVECLRLAGEAAEARRRLDLLAELHPPVDVKHLVDAEGLRLAIAARRMDDLEALIADIDSGTPDSATATRLLPELDLARLEAYLALWQDASRRRDRSRSDRWRTAAEALLAQFAPRHGPYWTRRAEGLLVEMIGRSPQTAEPAVLARVADAYYGQGRVDEALATYDRAREAADVRHDRAKAFELAYKAAAVEHARDAHVQARERFRALALSEPTNAKAAEAHLLAIFNAAQELKAASPEEQAGAHELYIALIEEHLRQWPNAPTASDAAWSLARLYDHEQAWEAAIAAYGRVATDHARYVESLDAIGRAYTLWLAAQAEDGRPTSETATVAAEYFERAALGDAAESGAQFTQPQRVAALWAARFWVHHLHGSYQRASHLLETAARGPGVPAQWRTAAVPLLVVALAAQGRAEDARRIVGESGGASTGEILAMLDALARIADGASSDFARRIADVQIDAARLVRSRGGQLDAADRRRLDLLEAGALATADRQEEAGKIYNRLADAYPNDGDVQEQYAAWLASRGDEDSLKAALSRWSEINRRSRPGSERWFRAQYALADAYHRLGQDNRAVRLLSVAETLYPSLGGPVMKARIQKLLEVCRHE